MSVCSFQSASSWTRPCCMITRLKCLAGSKVSRLMSLFIFGLLTGVDYAGIHPGRGAFVQAGTQIGVSLGLIEIVESAHLRFVVRAARDFLRARIGKLAVSGCAIARAVEIGFHARLLARYLGVPFSRRDFISGELVVDRFRDQIGLALVPARGARFRGHVAESHAPYLSPCDADTTGENAVLRQGDGVSCDFAHHGGAGDSEQRI